ncbi:L-rhamnose mutarotase [Sphingobacterium shayense]|uniref:L-rhamnose mutarotase n=1 Tax=Sphingobacterium shayense TaxID=626343 RepID=UPI001C131D2E|nr:L-rhamnose mutarotase [Sphingobacterium shayense]
MKDIKQLFYYSRFLLLFVLVPGISNAGDIYVEHRADINLGVGTREAPFSTLEDALRLAREWRRLGDERTSGGINIWIAAGVYTPTQTILIRPEDSGTAASPTRIKASGKPAVLSGGVSVNGWRKAPRTAGASPAAQKKLWVAPAPKAGGRYFTFRQLWVNGEKATRAQSHDDKNLPRILNWDFNKGTATISNDFDHFKLTDGMEFFIHQWWATASLRVADAAVHGDSIVLSFHQPEARLQNEHPWPKPWLSTEHGNSAFKLVNALAFVDEPGEWYLDEQEQKVYYFPRPDEDLATSTAVAPNLETILKFEGTLESPVSHVHIDGINFMHSSWLRPTTQGHVALQAGMFFLDAYKLKEPGTPDKKGLENQAWVGRPEAALSLQNTAFTVIRNCSFEHLASTGVDYVQANNSDTLQGNLFQDIGGSAVLLGKFSDENLEAHLPYNPLDQRLLTDGLEITNNLIQEAGTEDWGTVGIGAGYVRNVKIEHNELLDLPYTGISLGWGWTPTINSMKNNVVRKNRIVRYGKYMYDVAGIYTLSAQPGTRIEENLIDSIYVSPYAHLPDHWFYLYTDEGSAYMTVRDNWFPANKILQNANGPNVDWRKNGPQVQKTSVSDAGLTAEFLPLRERILPLDTTLRFNSYSPLNKPAFFQVYDPQGKLNEAEIGSFVSRLGGDVSQIYRWKDYTLIMTLKETAKKMQKEWETSYPSIRSTVFDEQFYSFQADQCAAARPVADKDFVLLRAQLVEDEDQQESYLEAHQTQYEKWPEVAQGFCNAGFQQVYVYKQGRQLLLLISFKKGQQFEEIDPLTTKDNPRVAEWNKLMSTYQQGIEGTKEGETWIFFKK